MNCNILNLRHLTVLLILCTAFLGGAIPAFAQQGGKKMTGQVIDENKEPMIGVSILIVGTSTGTVTDFDGNYTLNVPKDSKELQFSYVGYETKVITIPVNSNVLNVQMKSDSQVLSDVVIIGYGTQRKSDLTGSVASVGTKDFNKGMVSSPEELVNGKIAGVQIVNGGGSPTSVSTIRIRGGASLNASNDPLIVLDGVPMEVGGSISGGGNFLSLINPNDIESMTVLKDASSTAIYGSRGANGVVIITTKRARKEAKLSVSYDGYVGVSKSFKNYDMMSGEKYADWKRMANYGKTDKEIFDDIQLKTLNSGQFVDWQDLMFSGTGYKTDHNVSINQSNGRNRNMLVLGYNKDQSIIDNMGYERFSARINGDMELAKNLTVGYSSLLALTTRNNGDNSVWKYGTVIDPLTEVYDENGDMRFYNSGWYQTVLHSNPLFDTDKNNVDNKEKRTRILLNLFADWEIIKGLKFRTSLTYGLSSIENGVYKSSTSQARQLASPSAEYKKTNEQQITFTNVLNYKKVLNDHSLDVSLVHDMQTDKAELVGLTGQDMPYYGSWFNVNEAPDVFTRLSSVRKWALL